MFILRLLIVAITGVALVVPIQQEEQDILGANPFLTTKYINGMERLVKWGTPRLGTGAVITYAFLTSGELLFVEGGQTISPTCPYVGPIDTMLKNGLSLRILKNVFRRAVERWEAVANVVFVYATDQSAADVLIGVNQRNTGHGFANQRIDEGVAVGEVSTIVSGVLCFNPLVVWTLDSGTEGKVRIEATITHELGHVIGIGHLRDPGAVMYSKYSGNMKLQKADKTAAQYLYGDKRKESALFR